jgi:hypothetical protein
VAAASTAGPYRSWPQASAAASMTGGSSMRLQEAGGGALSLRHQRARGGRGASRRGF